MGSFLKEILELSEQDAFDHLISMEQPPIDTFNNLHTEAVLPSPNVGLPRHLIQIQRPGPAYVTHTGPLVRMLMEQDEQREASSKCPAQMEPNTESQGAGFEEETQVLSRGSSTAGSGKDSVGVPTAQRTLPPQNVYHRVIFARKHPSRVLPRAPLVCSRGKE